MTVAVRFGPEDDALRRRDINDNATEYIIVGSVPDDRQIDIEYTIDLPITNKSQTGRIIIIQDSDGIDFDHHYSFASPEFDEVDFSSDISGTDIRLVIMCSGLGENPKFLYRLKSIPTA